MLISSSAFALGLEFLKTYQNRQKDVLQLILCRSNQSLIFMIATGSHLEFIKMSKIVQSCHLANQAKFVPGRYGSTKPSVPGTFVGWLLYV